VPWVRRYYCVHLCILAFLCEFLCLYLILFQSHLNQLLGHSICFVIATRSISKLVIEQPASSLLSALSSLLLQPVPSFLLKLLLLHEQPVSLVLSTPMVLNLF
jgi:hypothetical protein